jgi:chromate transporter
LKTKLIKDIAGSFLYLGFTAYGGLAMVEPMRRRVVEEKAWLSPAEFLDGLALCQMLPGATMVQMATYAGYRLGRVPGALVAAAAFILPAFFLMWGLSYLYFHYGNLAWVKAVSRGLNAVVIALLLQAVVSLGQALGRQAKGYLIAILTLLALLFGINYLLVFLTAGLLGLVLKLGSSPGQGPSGGISAGPGPQAWVILAQVLVALALIGSLVLMLRHLDLLLGQMAWIFLKIGVISFGGGYVMIPVLQWEVVDHLGWLTVRQFLDGILLGYVTPGPLIILATFVGYWLKGFLGAAVATISIFLPPILMIIYLFPFYQKVKEARWMRPVIQGILAALVGMLALVTVQMGRAALTDFRSLALMAVAAAVLIRFKVKLFWVIAGAAGLSLFIY